MAANRWANTSFLDDRRRLAIELFPDLQTCAHEFFAFMSLYAREQPWKFFNKELCRSALGAFNTIRSLDDEVLIRFFREGHGEIEIALRSLDTINRARYHDQNWWTVPELERIRSIRELIHPAYLQLCEGVLKTLLHPIAVFERRKRGSLSEAFKPDERVEEARRAGLGDFEAFDSRVRNAIAHGSVAFSKDTIEYRDLASKHRRVRTTTPPETLRMFEDLLDTCNGLAAALRVLVLVDTKLFFSELAPVAPALVFPELQYQLDTAGWHVRDYLEFEYGDGQRDLNLFVDATYFDDYKTQLSVIRTAVFASRFAPSFDRCYVMLDRRGRIGGWGLFETKKVRELFGADEAGAYIEGLSEAAFVVMPLWRHFRVGRVLRLVGSIVDVFRTTWPAIRSRTQRPQVRNVRAIYKPRYICITATTVLHIDDISSAVKYVAINVRALLRGAVRAGLRDKRTPKWLRWLPVGYVEVDVHLTDRRLSQLVSSGLGANLLCRIVRKTRGQIQILPLHESLPQKVADAIVFWNRAAIETLPATPPDETAPAS
jgi:hypothetical protein